MSVSRADGYAVFNYFVPLRRGLRLPDGITFDGVVTQTGGTLSVTEPLIYGPDTALPPLEDPMEGALRIRLLRADKPHPEMQLWHDYYSRFVRLTGRPNEMAEDARAPEGRAVCTIAQLQVSSPCKIGSNNSLAQADRDAFNWGLSALRELQYLYRQAIDGFAAPVSRENLPPMMWMDAMIYTKDGNLVEDRGVGAFNSGGGAVEEVDGDSISPEQVRGMLSVAWSPYGDALFQRYNIFLLDSRKALYLIGDYRATILSAAIAVECLLDDLLSYALWWEGMSPLEAKPILVKPIYKKIKAEFAKRFYGIWLPQKGTILNWHDRVARVRDRIIHGGYHPTPEEAEAALAATRGVRKYLTRIVTDKRVRKRYRHLPLLLLGPSRLREHHITLDDLKDWYTSPLSYGQRLDNWRSICRRLRVEHFAGAGSVVPELEKASSFTVVTQQNISHYAVDVPFALACEVAISRLLPSERIRLRRDQEALAEEEVRVLPFVEIGTPSRSMTSDWQPAEELLPGYDFMRPEQAG